MMTAAVEVPLAYLTILELWAMGSGFLITAMLIASWFRGRHRSLSD